jgi:hypothetical protein
MPGGGKPSQDYDVSDADADEIRVSSSWRQIRWEDNDRLSKWREDSRKA